MPVDPDCDTGDCGDEPPDPDPGCCGSTVCEENETCCNETTCVLTSSFQTDSSNCGGCGNVCPAGQTCVNGVCTGGENICPPGYISCGATGGVFILDSDVEWTWVSNDGCPEGCVAFKAEQPTAEEEAAGLTPGDFSYDGICCELEPGCCTHWNCTHLGDGVYQYTAGTPYESSEADCIMPITEFSGDPSIPCNSTPLNMNNNYNTWSAEPCPTECNNVFLLCEGFQVNEPGWQPPPPPYFWILHPNVPNNSCNAGCTSPVIGTACNNYGEGQEEPCYAPGPAPMSYNPASQLALKEEPCSQEECEAHVSTWMAEPIGEPNEEGLYKVKWILLDGCPGACCSDQPTQPEFVKTSTLVDAPCKCGCD